MLSKTGKADTRATEAHTARGAEVSTGEADRAAVIVAAHHCIHESVIAELRDT